MNDKFSEEKIQALILPLRQQNLILPQVALVEVLPTPDVRQISVAAPWVLGSIDWRHHDIPLISLERYCGWPLIDSAATRRVAVLQGISGYKGLDHYAIETQGIPHPIRLGKTDVIAVDGELNDSDAVQMHVQAAGVRGVILALEQLEQQLKVILQN